MSKYLLFAIMVIATMGTSCSRYSTLDPQRVGVVAERPYALFNREAGGTIWPEVLQPGQRNLKRGPVIRFDVPVSVEQYEFALDVNMADRINQDIKVIVNYNLIGEGMAPIHLILNALPLDALKLDNLEGKSFDLQNISGGNTLKIVTFHPDEVFKKLIHPSAEMIIRDNADEFNSIAMDEEKLRMAIETEMLEYLSTIKFPMVTIDPQGRPYFCDTCYLKPLDLIKINGVMVKDYQMPEELAPEIQRAKTLQADIQAMLNEEEGLAIDKKIQMDAARTASAINKNLRTLYESNPYALPYSKLKSFMEEIESGKFKNVTLKVVPEGSTALIK